MLATLTRGRWLAASSSDALVLSWHASAMALELERSDKAMLMLCIDGLLSFPETRHSWTKDSYFLAMVKVFVA